MLEKAFLRIPDNTNLLLHSDQGWQYQMKHYQAMLNKKGIVQSMSRKGNCLDNSVMENFFGIIKQEMYYGKIYRSFNEKKIAITEYIHYYNNKRIKEKLNWRSPVNYRLEYESKVGLYTGMKIHSSIKSNFWVSVHLSLLKTLFFM